MKLLRTLAVALLSLPSVAHAADVRKVLAVPRHQIETADYRAVGRLVRIDPKGARTNYGVTVKAHWFAGVLRILVDIGAPQQARSHVLLEMRPNGQNVIRIVHPGDKTAAIVPFDKWDDSPFGPGFSYEDFLQPEFYWPGQTELEETRYGARDCDVVKSAPGPNDRTHYAEIKTWLDHSIGFPVYVEKILKESGTTKQFTYIGLRHEGGVWSASQVEGKIRGQAGSTLFIIERGSAKANLTLGDFSPESLTRF